MATSEWLGATDTDLDEAKRFIRVSGNGRIARSYFRETQCSVEHAEINSKGMYCFEKLSRLAFIQAMQEDMVLGHQSGFIGYINSLSESFEVLLHISDWQPEESAKRICNFMISFYNIYSYQWKLHGRPVKKSLVRFLDIMRECLDFGYLELSDRFNTLPNGVKDVVNKTFFLANSRIDEWYEEKQSVGAAV
jgi:hypothetical protein